MSVDVRSLITEHQACYEVSPYYVVLNQRHGSLAPTSQRVQAGFDIDVYGVNTENDTLTMPPPHKYALGYAALQRIAEEVSHGAADSCSVEVIPFPARVVLDGRGQGKVKAVIRIRISHWRGLDQPAGEPEHLALEKVEERLKALGIAHR
jgi:hypothetical protein